MKRIILFLLLIPFIANSKLIQNKQEMVVYSAMMHAIETNDVVTAKELIRKKINLYLTEDSRAAPTFITQAAYAGDLEIVKLLLANGADIEDIDGDMNTPLLLAIKEQHINVAKYLISSGADIEVTNKYGDSSADLANKTKNQELIHLLSLKNSQSEQQ
jgi:hypothetical protein